jgi:hypothetical protein
MYVFVRAARQFVEDELVGCEHKHAVRLNSLPRLSVVTLSAFSRRPDRGVIVVDRAVVSTQMVAYVLSK